MEQGKQKPIFYELHHQTIFGVKEIDIVEVENNLCYYRHKYTRCFIGCPLKSITKMMEMSQKTHNDDKKD